jgi:uncharacterized protein YkwD
MDMNWIDLLVGTLVLLGALIGWRRGFLSEFPALAALLASLWLATMLYPFASQWLAGVTDWRAAWTKPLGFLLILCAGLLSQRWLYVGLISRLPQQVHRHPINRLLGIAPGAAHGLVQAVIVAALLIALPLPEKWQTQTQARDSALNARFAGYADTLQAMLRSVFDDAIDETLTMLTVQPQTKETIKLPFTVENAKPQPALEEQMLALVNSERVKADLKPLVMHGALTTVARQHSAAMLARGYFSHYSPEGKTAFDRLRAQRIAFLIAGENLALAPTVTVAHTGLKHSPGHRANILRPQFGKVGIGILDAGRQGIMVTQNFSN